MFGEGRHTESISDDSLGSVSSILVYGMESAINKGQYRQNITINFAPKNLVTFLAFYFNFNFYFNTKLEQGFLKL